MSLILPGSPAFQWSVDNLNATDTTNMGTAVSGNAAANTDGTAVSILSALTYDACYVVIGLGHTNPAAAQDGNALLDLLVDPAGGTSWSVLVSDLLAGRGGDQRSWGFAVNYYLPLWIKAGSTLGLQIRCTTGGTLACSATITVYGQPKRPEMWWCGQGVETLGNVAASSKGTNVVPGASNTYGSWTTIGTSTRRYGALQFGVNGPATTVQANESFYWQFGSGSNQLAGTVAQVQSGNTNEVSSRAMFGPTFCDVKPGTILQARCASSAASPLTPNAAVYGVY